MTKLPDEWVAIAILRFNAIGVMVFLTDEDYWAIFGLDLGYIL